RCGDSVVRSKYVIKKMTDGNHSPLIGVMAFVRPVEARLLVEQGVRKGELNLAVAHFVQRTEQRHVTPSRGAPKSAHASLTDGRQVLGHCDGPVVQDDRGFPARVQVLKKPGAHDSRPDGVHRGVLLRLIADVLTVTDLVRLIPGPPSGSGYAMAMRERFRENLCL